VVLSAEPFSNDEFRQRVPTKVKGRDVVLAQSKAKRPATALFATMFAVAASRDNFARSVEVVLDHSFARRFDGAFLATLFDGIHAKNLHMVQGGQTFRQPTPASVQRSAVEPQGKPLLWGGTSHPGLLNEVGRAMRVKPRAIAMREGFTVDRALPTNPKGQRVFMVQAKQVGNAERYHHDLLETLYVAWQAKRQGAAEVNLVLPYLPYTRSDRADQAGVTVGAALLPQLAKAVGVDRVTFYSAHQAQEVGMFTALGIPVAHGAGEAVLAPAIAKKLARFKGNRRVKRRTKLKVAAPDGGAVKRARLFAKLLALALGLQEPLEVVIAHKVRKGSKTKTTFPDQDVGGATLVAIDDETASGGTMHDLAEAALNAGAREVIAVVDHLAGVAQKVMNSNAVEKIYVLDTLAPPKGVRASEKVERVPLGNALGSLLKGLSDAKTPVDHMLFFEN
jgi:ribose-phosphate pyrophosphokinase